MKRAIYTLFAVLVLFVASQPLWAAYRGQVINARLSVCLDKADAIAVIDTDAKDGHGAALLLWAGKERCRGVHVHGPQVGQVVHTAKVQREGETHTVRVVEIVSEGQVIGYFFTTEEVTDRKTENKS